ncbi:lipase chaperone [Weissella oryzae]|nr:lipase chaperone [Weissella oryzae]
MTNKTKIIIVSIVGVIVIFGIGALVGNLMHSNNNTTAKTTTAVSNKSSKKASSSSSKIMNYVEGKDYSIERTEVDGVTNSVVDNTMLKMGISLNQNNNMAEYMKKYVTVVVYYDNNPLLGGNSLIFEATSMSGEHNYLVYDLEDQRSEDYNSVVTYFGHDVDNGTAKQVWKFTNIDSKN